METQQRCSGYSKFSKIIYVSLRFITQNQGCPVITVLIRMFCACKIIL